MTQCRASKILCLNSQTQVFHRCVLPDGHFGYHRCLDDNCSHEWLDEGPSSEPDHVPAEIERHSLAADAASSSAEAAEASVSGRA